MLKKLDSYKFKEYSLILAYFTSFFSATCFFFDAHKIAIFGTIIQFPVGLVFFPLTFALSNIIQDKLGKNVANSLVLAGFIFNNLLVFGSYFLASIGDRLDYFTVFKDMTTIMISTWFFIGIASVFNILLYAYLQRIPSKNIIIRFLRFFISITATEILISTMSMPLLFYKHGLQGSVCFTLLLVVTYKLVANLIISSLYGLFNNSKLFT